MHVVEGRSTGIGYDQGNQVFGFRPLERERVADLTQRHDRTAASSHEKHEAVGARNAALSVPDDAVPVRGRCVKVLAGFQHVVECGRVCQALFLKQILAPRENVNGAVNWNTVFDTVPKTCRPNDMMEIERIDACAFQHVADRPDISLGCSSPTRHVRRHNVILRNPLGAVLDGAVIQIRQRQMIEIPP